MTDISELTELQMEADYLRSIINYVSADNEDLQARVKELEGIISELWNSGISKWKYLHKYPEEVERLEKMVCKTLNKDNEQ